ncbi:hypothetical protein PPGU19_099800 (plasmid) [Paraburkholderia sp. PGU19]|uniref:hypothetical protein n=1 Tax=Paraburkholderia sp. PGU19 TaxID=2735434 RepID=UPI0015DBC5AB|nr:hypothetical protein [Paraburkholderia sp. PGU19]BCG05412.1 hypothetical protein PPGU19_099800 [Paraburkholderia sp. PGU19]
MRQTVIGVYDSYVDACSAQRALCEAGVAQADISLYSASVSAPVEKGPRVYTPGSGGLRHQTPVFDQLEQLFARLFESGEYPPEAEDYREFIRRGGTIVSADVSEMQVDLARNVMRRMGAADIEERMNAWRNGSGKADIAMHSLHRGSATAADPAAQLRSTTSETSGAAGAEATPMLREGGSTAERSMAFATAASEAPASLRDTSSARVVPPATGDVPGTWKDEPGDTAYPATVSGMQQVTTRSPEPETLSSTQQTQRQVSAVPDVGLARTSSDVPAQLKGGVTHLSDNTTNAVHAERSSMTGLVGDPIMGTPLEDPYDDEFRKDFDAHYADTGSSYDEYRRAYTHGATLGQDERYREQDWQRVESSAREDWESRYPESGWERFKAAVRHGWERVTGH